MKWQTHSKSTARRPAATLESTKDCSRKDSSLSLGLKRAKSGGAFKPRNPHVAASRLRKAGAHGRSQGGARAEAMRELRQQVKDLPPRGP